MVVNRVLSCRVFCVTVMFLLTLVSSVSAAVGEWSSNGPYGGGIRGIAIDAATPSTVYAVGGAGVYKSTDAGASWTGINTGLTGHNINVVVIDPTTPSTLYAGSGVGDGTVFKSTNGGASWAPAGTTLHYSSIHSISVNPTDSNSVYAGTDEGVFKSEDAGQHWTHLTLQFSVSSVAIDPATPTTLYAGSMGQGIYKSLDGGTSWTLTDFPVLWVNRVVLDRSTPSTLYVGTSGYGIYKSADGGASWTKLFDDGGINLSVTDIAVDPVSPAMLYISTLAGPYRSANGGQTWTHLSAGATFPSAVATDGTGSGTVYLGDSYEGMRKTVNGGDSWVPINTGLNSTNIHVIALDPASNGTVYAGGENGAAYQGSVVNGWSRIDIGSGGAFSGNVTSMVAAPTTPTSLYAGTAGGGLYKRTTDGSAWSYVSSGFADQHVYGLALDPTDPTKIYAGSLAGVYKSTNAGAGWTQKTNGLTNTLVYSLAVNPSNPADLYAGTGDGVFRSSDGGENWNQLPFPSNVTVLALALDPANSTIYAGTTGLYKSTDSGGTWTLLQSGTRFNAILIDPRNRSFLYAGTDTGVLVSTDAGATWSPLGTALTGVWVNALAQDPSSPNTIYAGTTAGVQSITLVAPTTTASLVGGTYAAAQNITLAASAPATIYYTTDGTDPTTSLTKQTYTGPIAISASTALKFYAFDGLRSEAVKTVIYTIDMVPPSLTASPAPGAYSSAQQVILSSNEPATIYYTLDGTDPTTSATKTTFASAISLTRNSTLRYYGIDTVGNASAVQSATYLIDASLPSALWHPTQGPEGGDVSAIAIDPQHSQNVYAATGNGGLFKSTDGGATWNVAKSGLSGANIDSIAIDPADSQTIYLGSWAGVFKSTNGGATWNLVNRGTPTSTIIYTVAIDPQNNHTIYAGTGNGVLKSIDGGDNWTLANTGLTRPVNALAFGPTNSQTIFAGSSGGGVFQSVDGGASWNAVKSGLTENQVKSIAVDPVDGQTIFVATSDGGVFKSVNGGGTWTAANSGLAGSANAVVIDPTSRQTVYVGNLHGAYKSTNGGGTWSRSSTGLPSMAVSCLAIDPLNSQTFYAGISRGRGVYKSSNGANTWSPAQSGLVSSIIYSVAIDSTNPSTVYTGTSNGVLFKSTNKGGSWQAISSIPTTTAITAVLFDARNSQIIYAATENEGVLKSTNGGGSWTRLINGLTASNLISLALDPNNSQVLYAGTNDGVFKSSDGGGSWAQVGLAGLFLYSIVVDPNNSQTVYSVEPGTGVFRSTDGGGSWSLVNNGLTTVYVQDLAIDPNSQSLYVGSTVAGVFKSTDGGDSWTQVNSGITSPKVCSLAVAPSSSQTIFAGTQDGMLFRSTNGGSTWSRMDTGANSAALTLAIDPTNSDTIYAGTYNGVQKGLYPGINGTPATNVTTGLPYSFTPTTATTASFSISNKPSWASFDTNTGALTGTPMDAQAGVYSNIVISATNGTGTVSLPAFSITAVLPMPTIGGTPATSVSTGNLYSFTPTATTATSFGISNKPSWANFDTSTGALTGTPNNAQVGVYSNIVISVTNSTGTVSLPAFSITAALPMPTIGGAPATSITTGTSYSFTPTATTATSFSVSNKPSWASFDTATGALTGTPTNAQVGVYSNIVISVTNSTGTVSLPAFSITAALPMPTIGGTPATSVTTGNLYSFTPTATTATSFSVSNKPSWASFDTATGALTGTPTNTQVGVYSNIVISVTNSTGTVSLPAFSIAAALPMPTIGGAPATTVTTGTLYSFTPTSTTATSFGISNKPSWASFDTATGALAGTPTNTQVGVYSNIVISVTNSTGTVSLPAFSISAALPMPTIGGVPATSITTGNPYSFSPTATTATSFSVSNKPSWASFDTATGALTGTPNNAQVGVYSNIVISVTNSTGTVSLPAFSITAALPMPTIGGVPATSITTGTPYSFTPTATTATSFSVSNKPSWASFDTATGALTGTPTNAQVGVYSNIVISVTNSTGTVSLPAFSITAALPMPTIGGTPATSVTTGTPYSFTPTATTATSFSISNKPSWASFDATTGALTGTPNAANIGTYSNIVITVSNSTGSLFLPAFSITVLPPLPTIVGTPATTVLMGSIYTFTPTATDAIGFTISNRPTWASFNPTTGALTGTPAASDAGTTSNIVISATNASGSASLAPFSIAVTFPAPSLTVSTLSDNSVTKNATLNISGVVTSANVIKGLTINGSNVPIGSDGSFNYALILAEGANTVRIIATDADNSTTDSRTIILDSSAPAISLAAPPDHVVVGMDSISISGSLSETGTVQVVVGDSSAQFAAMDGNQFSFVANLKPGSNTIVISASDLAGNISTVKRTVVYDRSKPNLAITDPAQDLVVTQGQYLIKGSAGDADSPISVSIAVDGQTLTPTVKDGTFEQQIALPTEKQYAVVVTATDQAGNSTTTQRNIIFSRALTGDINGDSTVDISDALLAMQIAVGAKIPTADELARGDVGPLVNGKPVADGNIDISDVVLILEKSVGLLNW
ncbi:putative Ig domain-containing protein [Geomesophilobacter sediminis]|uniref:Chitobiase/beta-hexosaminidase C-terminal domain-containing protein n=1 Tax=Geomesophilobacter sediminis TaxID=2798584 RepID=A0A8J7LVA9_9BACT|nr:putative Ig domain-containing protein [Geomesophilobacter sediminis]MBJ6724765.1 chitobiase/beta-hexosaminidase C-terminal domain-containing protein [Geomesophilobacter sediminis]